MIPFIHRDVQRRDRESREEERQKELEMAMKESGK